MFRLGSVVLVLSLVIGFGSCSDSSSPPVATSITVLAPGTTLNALGLTLQLTAQVMDKKGKVMTGVPVSWSSSDNGLATVSSSGLVTAVGRGSVTITATAESANGSVNLTISQDPASLVKVRGDFQEGIVGQALSEAPSVRVLDSQGHPIPTVTVSFFVTAGGGSVSGEMKACDSAGEAAVDWTLGTDAGTGQTLTATVGALSAEFSATALAGPAAALAIQSGNEQTAQTLQSLEHPLVVAVEDQFGNEVSGAVVQWATGSGSGQLLPASGQTNEDGSATSLWTLGPLVGVQSASATVETLGTVSFSAVAQVPPLIEILVLPSNPFIVTGESVQLSATATAVGGVELLGVPFAWTSSDPTVAAVDQDGMVTAQGAGTATISAKAGESDGTTTVTVSSKPQQPGVRIEVPATAVTGQTVQARLILNTAGIPHSVGALSVTIEWDSAVIGLDDGGSFESDYRWNALVWTSAGRLKIAFSVPLGLTGEVQIFQFPIRVGGPSGSASDLVLTVDRAISALTFQEIGSTLPAISARLEVS